jgi:hypothetical protein
MAIIRKSLGNNPEVIEQAFRDADYTDGLGGYGFKAFLDGWTAAWKARNEQIERLKEYTQHKHDCPALQEFYIPECPKCGQRNSHWRNGVGFDHERYCENCENVWEPERRFGECTCGLEHAFKSGKGAH